MIPGRRQLLKFLGAAPFTIGSAAPMLKEHLASPILAVATTLGGGEPGAPIPAPQSPLDLFRRTLQSLRKEAEDEYWAGRDIRQHGLDADIAALKSTSMTYKVRKQLERDLEFKSLSPHAEERLYG